ncbi:MAG: glycosyltransferase, partial [Thiotrichaceae bacterium]|nr:glycosyltransferase [Thiotrichaceae bacterium]
MSKHLIAHVIYRFGMGGLENGLVNIINRLPDEQYQHVIICMTDHGVFSGRLNKSVEIYDMHKKPGKDLMLYFRLWKLFRKIKPDIVHSRNMSAL